jgi:hypothetical protein
MISVEVMSTLRFWRVTVAGSGFAAAALVAIGAVVAIAASVAPALVALNGYWADVGAGRYAAAYQLLEPGALGITSARFVAEERSYHIEHVKFRGYVAASARSTATIDVSVLKTVDATYGCRSWTGSYSMVLRAGHWLIARSNISPHACTISKPKPTPSPPASATEYVRDFSGNKLAVTTSFEDPAIAENQFEAPSAGEHLVAVHLTLKDLGPGGISNDANSDTTIVGSDT